MCVRGSSALQDVLQQVPGELEVFAVWEPILRTDLVPPTSNVLSNLRDLRARQYWDPEHLMSAGLVTGMGPEKQSGRGPLLRKGLVWDTVAVFKPGARWEGQLPRPDYVGSDVVDSVDDLTRLLLNRGAVP